MRTEDGQIIQECLNGEPEAFGVLVDKYKEGIYAFVYAKLGNFRDAQDVTQEVFLKAYRDLHSLKRWESFAFWLYRIAYARCAELLRVKSKRIDLDFIEDQDSKIIDAPSLDYYREYQLSESVRDALDSLPEAYREVLMLHYFGGMNSNEIANALGTSPTAIRMRLSRARAQLKEEMITMIGTVFEGQKLRIGFTFHIVEAIKQIRIQPVSPKILPWGLSLATGIIVIFLNLGTSFNLPYTIGALSGSPLPGETKVLKTGEIPVDAIKVSNISVISNQRLNRNGLGSGLPNMQNALFMDPQADVGTWTKRADMPTARSIFFTSEVNGKIYAIGGYDGIKELSTVEEYDPMTDKWVKKADMPTSRIQFSGCAVNGKIYAIGGWRDENNIELSTVEEYDPIRDKWTKKANMLFGRQSFCASVVDGKIYAIGGWRLGVYISTVEEYDPEKDEWVKKADMPTARGCLITCTVNGKIYAIGGNAIGLPGKGKVLTNVEEYNPKKDEWVRKADMPAARMYLSGCAANGKVYAVGGRDKDYFVVSTVEAYNPATDTWMRKTDISTARSGLSTSVANGKIYAIGGSNDKSYFSIVEEYDPEASENVNFKGKLPTTWGEMRTAMSK